MGDIAGTYGHYTMMMQSSTLQSVEASHVGHRESLSSPATSGRQSLDSTKQSAGSDSVASLPSHYRRSCQHCRKRKIRCVPSLSTQPATLQESAILPENANEASKVVVCKACEARSQPCVFEAQSTMGRPPKSKQRERELANLAASAKSPAKRKAEESLVEETRSFARDARTLSHETPFRQDSSSGRSASSSSSSDTGRKRQHSEYAPQQPLQVSQFSPYSNSAVPSALGLPGLSSFHLPLHSMSSMHYTPHHSLTPINPCVQSSLPSLGSASTAPSSACMLQTPSIAHSPALSSYQATNVKPFNNEFEHAAEPVARFIDNGKSDGSSRALCLQTEADPSPFFQDDHLHDFVAAFHRVFTAPESHSPPSLSSRASGMAPLLANPHIPPIARIRTLTARAMASRKPVDRSKNPASPDYARSLISSLWAGLPVDIVSLSSTGRPSTSGPFSITSEASKRLSMSGQTVNDEFLFAKLLREDESHDFAAPSSSSADPSAKPWSVNSHPGSFLPLDSPCQRYAPDKMAVGKFFTGYFSTHPLAPLIMNERLFLDDLMAGKVDTLLVHVIVGAAIARAPCLGAGTTDAEEVGNEFYEYIERELLSRRVSECHDLQTIQAIMLWATHELSHMRTRRATALWATADVLLRRRLNIFQQRLNKGGALSSNVNQNDAASSDPQHAIGWRDLVEHELTTNALWVLVIWTTWTSLSMKLPHNTMSIMASTLPLPPQSVTLSSSFAYSYSTFKSSSPAQPIVRRTIERFSDTAQLINVIVAMKNQAQAKNAFAPDPPRPLAIVEDDETQVATWLVDLAKYYRVSEPGTLTTREHEPSLATNTPSDLPESSRTFLAASHAVLALHQILPYATNTSPNYGSPVPLPTLDSLRTALQALEIVSVSIQTSAPSSRTRTQAILLDAMPRILALLDILTSSSLTSLDHFVLLTSQRQTVHNLLADLNKAMAAMGSLSQSTRNLDVHRNALGRSSQSLRAVVDITLEAPVLATDSLIDFSRPLMSESPVAESPPNFLIGEQTFGLPYSARSGGLNDIRAQAEFRQTEASSTIRWPDPSPETENWDDSSRLSVSHMPLERTAPIPMTSHLTNSPLQPPMPDYAMRRSNIGLLNAYF